MKEYATKELVMLLMKEKNISMLEALDIVYTSDTFKKLSDTNTGLYFQSPNYIYTYLDNELKFGKIQ